MSRFEQFINLAKRNGHRIKKIDGYKFTMDQGYLFEFDPKVKHISWFLKRCEENIQIQQNIMRELSNVSERVD